jgi:DNA-binding NtrC family response regulator
MSQYVLPVTSEIVPVGVKVADVERELVLRTLAGCNGNRTHAARALGISVRTLRNRIRLYTARGIDVPAPQVGTPAN